MLNLKMNKAVRFKIQNMKPSKKMMKSIWVHSYPTIIQQSVMPVMTFGMNQLLLSMTAAAPAVYIIYARLQRFALIPVRGIKNAVISILSFNAGAGNRKRVSQTVHKSAACVLVITLAGFMIFRFAPGLLLSLFSPDNIVKEIGISALKILSLTIPVSGMTKILCAYFQSLGHSRKILIISIMQFTIQMTAAMLMVNFCSVYTIWWSFVVTETAVLLISLIILKKYIKERTENEKLISLILAASMMLTASACVLADEAKGGFSLKMQIDNPKMTVGGEEKSIDEEGTTPVIVNARFTDIAA